MSHRPAMVLVLALLSLNGTQARAQGGGTTGSLSGTVVDAAGGIVPGAAVSVKNIATGTTFDVVTNGDGAFSVPALDAGTYTVTIALMGFKTAVVNDVRLLAATPADLRVVLEVGRVAEEVTVRGGGAALVQTQSPTVSTTLDVDEIAKLPMATRNALNFITFLPGVDTPGINRDSTVSGLSQAAINITIDGVNVQDNYGKTGDGFFARVTPCQDAMEQVTVTTATSGANVAGQGAIQFQFVTRSGTNQFKGTAYHYFRHPSLNSIRGDEGTRRLGDGEARRTVAFRIPSAGPLSEAVPALAPDWLERPRRPAAAGWLP